MSRHSHIVNLFQSPPGLFIQWGEAPGEFPRPLVPALHARITQHLACLAAAERRFDPPALAVARRHLGETLFELIDGPECALQRRLEAARARGEPLHLVLRLRAPERQGLMYHPALGWYLQLLCPALEEPLALQPNVTLTVQLGDVEVASP